MPSTEPAGTETATRRCEASGPAVFVTKASFQATVYVSRVANYSETMLEPGDFILKI